MWLLEFFVIAAVVATVFVKRFQGRREAEREEETRATFRRRVVDDPRNLGAYEMLGDSFRRSDKLDEAVAAYSEAIDRIDDSTPDSRLQYQLEYKIRLVNDDLRRRSEERAFLDLARLRRKSTEPTICRECGAQNSRKATHCETCGRLLPLEQNVDAVKLFLRDYHSQRDLVNGLFLHRCHHPRRRSVP